MISRKKLRIKEVNILRSHGWQYIPDLKGVELSPLFRGRPVISDTITPEEIEHVKNICPVDAFVDDPFGLDMGKCIFCKECHFACPQKIMFTNDYKIAASNREDLVIRVGQTKMDFDHSAVRPVIRKLFKQSLKLRQISAAGDNSSEMELNASGNVNFDMGRYGIEFLASPRHTDGIVITGPISENMADALQICYDAVPEPKIIILAGSDAIGGGMFVDSPAINRTFLDKYHIDLFVPGNPMHPLTFINGVLSLIRK